MGKSIVSKSLLIAGGLMALAPSFASGEEPNGLKIADGDSVYVDGKSFQVIPGTAKGGSTVQIKKLGARDLGPAAIIIRSGNRLYIADAESPPSGAQAVAPGPSYAYDPRGYNPALLGGGTQEATTDRA